MNDKFKIIAKGVNNRLCDVHDMLDKIQRTFAKNPLCMEGVSILHEILHNVKRKEKMSGVLYKIDFEKSYENVNWACCTM